jgi:hypothetical protein
VDVVLGPIPFNSDDELKKIVEMLQKIDTPS